MYPLRHGQLLALVAARRACRLSSGRLRVLRRCRRSGPPPWIIAAMSLAGARQSRPITPRRNQGDLPLQRLPLKTDLNLLALWSVRADDLPDFSRAPVIATEFPWTLAMSSASRRPCRTFSRVMARSCAACFVLGDSRRQPRRRHVCPGWRVAGAHCRLGPVADRMYCSAKVRWQSVSMTGSADRGRRLRVESGRRPSADIEGPAAKRRVPPIDHA